MISCFLRINIYLDRAFAINVALVLEHLKKQH